MRKIGVLGAGTWGMALARMLCLSENELTVWSALKNEIDEFSKTRVHPNLPGMEIPKEIIFTYDIKNACENKDIILFAVPSVFVRETARKAAPFIEEGQIIVDVAKGIETDTLMTMSEIIEDEIGKNIKIVALSGPTHAEEVAKDLPTTIVSACKDLKTARFVQDVFATTCLRVYVNDDIKGVELCGALKNIIALVSGASRGLGYGDNTCAAIITRGLAEITRLGMAMGCKTETFSGLAGVGDLIVTATSIHSRNNTAGYLIGRGYSVQEAVNKVGMVVEGINALPAAIKLAKKHNVEMPIIFMANEVISGRISPTSAVSMLMEREQRHENDD